MNDEQRAWWWGFIGSLLLEGPLLVTALLILHISDNYKVVGADGGYNPTSPINVSDQPEPSASTSYKTILTINSIPTSHQSKKPTIKTVKVTPQQQMQLQQHKLQQHRSHHRQSRQPPPGYQLGQSLVFQTMDNNNPDGFMNSRINSPNAANAVGVARPSAIPDDTTPEANAAAAAALGKSPTTVIDMPKINKEKTRHTTKPIENTASPSAIPISVVEPSNMAAAVPRNNDKKRKFRKHSVSTRRKRDKEKDKTKDTDLNKDSAMK